MEANNLKDLMEKKEKFHQGLDAVLSSYLSGDELKEVNRLITHYYAEKLTREMDKLAEERG